VLHDGMSCNPVQGQAQGYETFKVGSVSTFKVYLFRHLQCELSRDY